MYTEQHLYSETAIFPATVTFGDCKSSTVFCGMSVVWYLLKVKQPTITTSVRVMLHLKFKIANSQTSV